MALELRMPCFDRDGTPGRVVGWRVAEGERIQVGQGVVEVETDKCNLELEAFASGVLLRILVPAGASAPPFALLGWIGEAGEPVADDSA